MGKVVKRLSKNRQIDERIVIGQEDVEPAHDVLGIAAVRERRAAVELADPHRLSYRVQTEYQGRKDKGVPTSPRPSTDTIAVRNGRR